MIYKLVTRIILRIIQYFCFPDRPMKGGDILDFYKGVNIRKRGGVWPPLPTMFYDGKINSLTSIAKFHW